MDEFKVIMDGLTDTSEAPRAKDIFYRCTKCGGLVPSVPPGERRLRVREHLLDKYCEEG